MRGNERKRCIFNGNILAWTRPYKLPNLATQAFQLVPPNVTNPSTFPRPTATAAKASAKLLPLATQPPESHSFPPVMLLLTPFFSFQWPQAPIADASMRLPPLVAQATQALQDVRNPTHFPWPTAAEARAKLPPPATQAHTSQTFPPVTNTPFFFNGLQLP